MNLYKVKLHSNDGMGFYEALCIAKSPNEAIENLAHSVGNLPKNDGKNITLTLDTVELKAVSDLNGKKEKLILPNTADKFKNIFMNDKDIRQGGREQYYEGYYDAIKLAYEFIVNNS